MPEVAKKQVDKLIQFPNQSSEGHITLSESELRQMVADVVAATKATQKKKEKPTNSLYTKDGRRKPTPADPIRSKEDFQKVVDYLGSNGNTYIERIRNKTIFVFGCNIGIRCGDLLNLKTEDVYEKDGKVKNHVELFEEKTGKRNVCKIPKLAKKALKDYWDEYCSERPVNGKTFLFPSRKGGSINVRTYYHILRKAGEACGLDIDLSTHSMRKTYAMSALQSAEGTTEAGDILMMLQTKFKHSDQRVTMHYVKLDQDKLDEMSDRVSDWLDEEE